MSSSPEELYVIFPAAGSGSRMRSRKNKLLLEIGGKTVISRTLSSFQEFASSNGIKLHAVLVVSPGSEAFWKDYIDSTGIDFIERITSGGNSRTASVANGVRALKTLSPSPDSIVFIHDAARCLTDNDTILRCFRAFDDPGLDVCVCGVRPKNTIKIISGGNGSCGLPGLPVAESTPPRDLLCEVQTPQCFRFEVLKSCCKRAEEEGYEATDDTALAERCGIPVYIVEGSYSNIKITTPEDIAIAESLLCDE